MGLVPEVEMKKVPLKFERTVGYSTYTGGDRRNYFNFLNEKLTTLKEADINYHTACK
jgi:hypothetical protein